MEINSLSLLFDQARQLCGHREFDILGSLSILGVAVSRYARGEPRDREWLQAGLEAGQLSAAIIESRFRDTPFPDLRERARATSAPTEDRRRVRIRRPRK
jgi:hypothetical protein